MSDTAVTLAANPPQLVKPRAQLIDLIQAPRTRAAFADLATKYLPAERMARICLSAVRTTPRLAECDPLSVLGQMSFLHSIGLEPNTPLGLAYLIPFEKRRKDDKSGQWVTVGYQCSTIIGYRGLIQLAYRTPGVVKFIGRPVYGGEVFEAEEGTNAHLRHVLTVGDEPPGPLMGAYGLAVFEGEYGRSELTTVMRLSEINERRDASETFQALNRAIKFAKDRYERDRAEKRLAETPWLQWPGEMAGKTAIRRLATQMPLGGPLAAATIVDDRPSADWGRLADDPDVVRAVADGREQIADDHIDDEPDTQQKPDAAATPPVQGGAGGGASASDQQAPPATPKKAPAVFADEA